MKFKLLEEVTKFAELADQQAEGIKILTASLLGEAPDMYWKHQNGLYMGLNNVTVETIRSFVNPSIVGMSDHNIYDPNVADHALDEERYKMMAIYKPTPEDKRDLPGWYYEEMEETDEDNVSRKTTAMGL